MNRYMRNIFAAGVALIALGGSQAAWPQVTLQEKGCNPGETANQCENRQVQEFVSSLPPGSELDSEYKERARQANEKAIARAVQEPPKPCPVANARGLCPPPAPPDLVERLLPWKDFELNGHLRYGEFGFDRPTLVGYLNLAIEKYGVQTSIWCWDANHHLVDDKCADRLDLLHHYGH